MSGEKLIMLRNRLEKVYRHLSKQAKRMQISCYRLYDGDLPEFPLCIEFYGGKLYIAEYKRRFGLAEKQHELWLNECISVISQSLQVAEENIFIKQRKRITARRDQYKKLQAFGSDFIVEENGFKFIVNLSDYLDTGLFLDHRDTRMMIRAAAEGKSVLNLFCYTGSFSVYAAAGGAAEVVSVDLSKTYLAWAEKNMKLNGFTDTQLFRYVQADVINYLTEQLYPVFDLIIMDPPTFSNSKRMEGFLDIQRDHVSLINHCLRILKPGGVLFFSTNYTKFDLEEAKISSDKIKNITKQTTPFDFAGKLERQCFRIEK
jgi:23S rRNA (cytosine1962-C5)-methyltransferase